MLTSSCSALQGHLLPSNRCRYFPATKQLHHRLQVREVYERAIANVPPAPEKRYWQRYIYLWIRYALWEELEAEDLERTRQVYKACLNLIPHSVFTFAKVSLPGSHLEHKAARIADSAVSVDTSDGSSMHGEEAAVWCPATLHDLGRSFLLLRRSGSTQPTLRSGRSACQRPGSSWAQPLGCAQKTSCSGKELLLIIQPWQWL